MPRTLHLTTVLQQRGPAGALILTDEQVTEVGGGAKAFPVLVTVNGQQVPLRLARMGGENMIGLRREVRSRLGVEVGDEVEALVALDDGPRTVEVPDDLAAAFDADEQARTGFDALAPSHRKEWVRWVTEAKREQTRAERVAATVEAARAGRARR